MRITIAGHRSPSGRAFRAMLLLGLGVASTLGCAEAGPGTEEVTKSALSSNAAISWRPLVRTDGAATTGYSLAAIMGARGREIASTDGARGSSWYDLLVQNSGYLQIAREGQQVTGSAGTSTPAQDGNSTAVASADYGMTTEVFYLTSNRSVATVAWNGTSFTSPPQPPPGTFLAGVGAGGTPNRVDLFGVGGDHSVWHASRTGTAWTSGWSNELGTPPNVLVASLQPAVVWRPDGVLHVFVVGTDGAVWTQRYQNGWSGWTSLAGANFGSGVTAALTGSTRLDVFVSGQSDGTVYRRYTMDGGNTWIPAGGFWESIGKPQQGVMAAAIDGVTRYEAPTAVEWGGGEVDVYVRDATGTIQVAQLLSAFECQRVADEFGIYPDNQWGFAPLEIQQWWTKNGCSATPQTSTNLCQKLSDIYGTTAWVTWGYAPASVQNWWSANGCLTSPMVSESLCQRASDTYGIAASGTTGTAPSYMIDWWRANGCSTSPHGANACQMAADFFGISAYYSWGFAPADAQSFWSANDCNEVAPTANVTAAQLCQNAANFYAMSSGSPGGAPAGIPDWFNTYCGSAAPTCQGLSEMFGVTHGSTWAYASWPASPPPTYISDWWISHSCQTVPLFSNDNCQRASNTFGISVGQTMGFAPNFVQSWWSASGCGSTPQPPLFMPAAKPFNPAAAAGSCTFNPATMVPQHLGQFSMTNTATATVPNDVGLGTFPSGTTVIVGFVGLGNPDVQGDTYLRLFDAATGEVASNDDACGTYGSRIVYTVPRGAQTLSVRMGCNGNEVCAGSLFLWSRLDSNGYFTDIRAAFNAMDSGVPEYPSGVPLSSSFGTNGLTSSAYTDCGYDFCSQHFQGVARLPIPGLGNVLALAGSEDGAQSQGLFFLKEFGATSNAFGSWHEHWSGHPNSSQSKFI